MTRLCYPCIVEQASATGKACIGEGDGYGTCDVCKELNRRLYRQRTLDDLSPSAAATPMPVLRRSSRRVPAPIWFGWSLVLMALGIFLALMLTSRCSEGAKVSLDDWCQTAIRRLPVFYEDNPPGGVAGRTYAKEAQLTLIAAEVAKASQKAPLPPRSGTTISYRKICAIQKSMQKFYVLGTYEFRIKAWDH